MKRVESYGTMLPVETVAKLRELAVETRRSASSIVRELVNVETLEAWAKGSTRWVGGGDSQ